MSSNMFLGVPKKWAVGPCKNESIADKILSIADLYGFKWIDDKPFTQSTNWTEYKGKTCYDLLGGGYCEIEWFKENEYKIISPKNFFKLADILKLWHD